MDVKVVNNADAYVVYVDGVIKSVSDSQSIKDAINSCNDFDKTLNVHITNSFSVTSSVIGFFLKKAQADKVKLNIYVTDERLYELFSTLNLVDILNVKQR